jgi:hypothetical protein
VRRDDLRPGTLVVYYSAGERRDIAGTVISWEEVEYRYPEWIFKKTSCRVAVLWDDKQFGSYYGAVWGFCDESCFNGYVYCSGQKSLHHTISLLRIVSIFSLLPQECTCTSLLYGCNCKKKHS